MDVVAYTCNPSYMRGTGRSIMDPDKNVRPYLKNNQSKMGWQKELWLNG
jgi:hypothetical protein